LSASDTPGDSGSSIGLAWTAATDDVGVTGYKVYRGTASGSLTLLATLGNVTSYTDTTATTGTRYYYAVSAVDAAGNAGAKSPEASAVAIDNLTPPPSSGGTLVDAGFESGTDGATLSSPPWAVVGTPQRREYDNTRARTGLQSAWIKGPATTSYAGVSEASSADMTSDGAEIRFWLYADTTDQLRRFYDNVAAGATWGPYLVLLNSDGTIQVHVAKASPTAGYITGYTTVGTQSVGWTQYRIVNDFTHQTYTLSTRANATDAWTPLKAAGAAGYEIPMRGSGTVTKTGGLALSSTSGANMWLDDVLYSASGISDP
jgi:hypothetical protein